MKKQNNKQTTKDSTKTNQGSGSELDTAPCCLSEVLDGWCNADNPMAKEAFSKTAKIIHLKEKILRGVLTSFDELLLSEALSPLNSH